MAKLPIFVESQSPEKVQQAIDKQIIANPGYAFIKETSQLVYIDTELKTHIVKTNNIAIERVSALPPVDEGNVDTLYVLNNYIYLFDGEMYIPTYKDYTAEIDAVFEQIEFLNRKIDEVAEKKSVIHSATYLDFPSIGELDVVYIADDENATYRWDADELKYYCIGNDWHSIEQINGGSSL